MAFANQNLQTCLAVLIVKKINQLKSETPNFPYISPRNLPGTAEKLLRKIKEDAERINDFKE